MSDITNIVKKELRELLTPGSVASVLIMVILFAAIGGMIGEEVDKAQSLPVFGLVNADDGTVDVGGTEWNVYDTLRKSYIASGVPESRIDSYIVKLDCYEEDLYDAMRENGISCAIVVDGDFGDRIASKQPGTLREYYIYEPTGMFGSVSSSVVGTVVKMLNSDLSYRLTLLEAPGASPAFLSNPITASGENTRTFVNGEAYGSVTPADISNQITSQTMMIPIIIMVIIMMVGSIVISSMGSEKENKTLETLLTLPIKRTSIVTGKIVAAAIVGLVYGLAYMVGMSIYMNAMTADIASGVNLADIGLGLGIADYALIMVSMFLAIVCALGICMILGAFAKNYKSAQTMTLPLSVLAMIPMFITMFSGWYGAGPFLQAVTFAIPFSHPMMAMTALMNGDLMLVLYGIAYMLVFAVGAILVTVKLYSSDILITGLGQNKFVQTLTGKK